MTNYDTDEIERKKSQKQKNQWREYVDKSLQHPLDSSGATKMPMSAPVVLEDGGKNDGFGRDDQDNIKNILRPTKECQQWDAQSQSYVEVGIGGINDQDNIRWLHENEEVTSPKHYEGLGITPLEYITANELDFLEGNIIKYITRYLHKSGVNDLLKARTYLEKLIEREVEKA
jgi:hypothetical protein